MSRPVRVRLLVFLLPCTLLALGCPSPEPTDDDDDAVVTNDDDSAPADDDDSAPGDDDDAVDDDDSAPGDDDDAAPPPLAGPCDLAERVGRFAVEANELYTVVSGNVADAVFPATVLEELVSDGTCSVLRQNVLTCEPACNPDQVCDAVGNCVATPQALGIGTVTVDGLVEAVSMTPIQPGFNYFDTGLPQQAMNPGQEVTLTAEGEGDAVGFTLRGEGLTTFDLGEVTWTLAESTPLTLSWPAAPEGAASMVELDLNIDIHNPEPSRLVCMFPDTGTAEVTAPMVDAFIAAGVSGFPEGKMRRLTVDSTPWGNGCVQFEVADLRTGSVDVEGFIPCNRQVPCPVGMTCNLAIELCE